MDTVQDCCIEKDKQRLIMNQPLFWKENIVGFVHSLMLEVLLIPFIPAILIIF